MPPVGFEPTISAGERPQTYVLDRAATGFGLLAYNDVKNLLDMLRRFGETCCFFFLEGLNSPILGKEAAVCSKMPVRLYQTTRCHIPEDGSLHKQCRENLA